MDAALYVTRDDGCGGADPAGSGLAGLARRVAAVDGELTVDSPPGAATDRGGAPVEAPQRCSPAGPHEPAGDPREDSALLREGLFRLLAEEGHEVVAAVGDGEALLGAVGPTPARRRGRRRPDAADPHRRGAARGAGDPPPLARHRRAGPVAVRREAVCRRARSATDVGGVGYLLKDRVAQVGEFLDALDRVGAGGAAFDPEVVRQLLARTTHADPLAASPPASATSSTRWPRATPTPRIAERLHISQSAVEKHVNAIFDKLGIAEVGRLQPAGPGVLRYLGSDAGPPRLDRRRPGRRRFAAPVRRETAFDGLDQQEAPRHGAERRSRCQPSGDFISCDTRWGDTPSTAATSPPVSCRRHP